MWIYFNAGNDRPYEYYLECGSNCEPTCNEPWSSCYQRCNAGCFCGQGYLREYRHNGYCVRPIDCPIDTCEYWF